MPEVDSAVIRIKPYLKSHNLTPSLSIYQGEEGRKETKKFFRVVKAGFSARRKMLVNNLSSSFHLDKKIVEEKLKLLESIRPQERRN